jgi:hypothetical protein
VLLAASPGRPCTLLQRGTAGAGLARIIAREILKCHFSSVIRDGACAGRAAPNQPPSGDAIAFAWVMLGKLVVCFWVACSTSAQGCSADREEPAGGMELLPPPARPRLLRQSGSQLNGSPKRCKSSKD